MHTGACACLVPPVCSGARVTPHKTLIHSRTARAHVRYVTRGCSRTTGTRSCLFAGFRKAVKLQNNA